MRDIEGQATTEEKKQELEDRRRNNMRSFMRSKQGRIKGDEKSCLIQINE